jgi:3-oxoacyl-[acyl-carrier protein] reductase
MTPALPLSGRTAIVTGGTRNIGRGVAVRLAQMGAQVCVASRQMDADTQHTLDLIAQAGAQGLHLAVHVAQEDEVQRMVDQTLARFGGLDILVHCAGIRRVNSLEDTPLSEWRDVMATNLDAAFLCSKAAVPHMNVATGRLIYISGVSAFRGSSHRAHVVASKAGLGGLARALAIELGDRRITVNCVAPGPIDTVRAKESGDIPHHPYGMATMLGHKGDTQDIAAMVGFLASDDGRFVTGQVVHVNGGMHFGT